MNKNQVASKNSASFDGDRKTYLPASYNFEKPKENGLSNCHSMIGPIKWLKRLQIEYLLFSNYAIIY